MTAKNYLKIIAYIAAFFILTGMAILQGLFFSKIIEYFVNVCPNIDVLSWDANLRLTYVIDQMTYLSRGQIVRALTPFFDAPTWPPLRAMISMIVQSLHPGGIDQKLEVYIGTGFMAATIATMLYMAIRLTGSFLRGAILWAFVSTGIWYTGEIPAYTLSAMLETQGMFFSLLAGYFLYRFYDIVHRKRDRVAMEGWSGIQQKISGGASEEDDQRIPATVKWGLLISMFGVFLTKYPYGVILILALIAYEMVSASKSYMSIVFYTINRRYTGLRRTIPILLSLVVLAFALSGFVEDLTGYSVNNKTFKNFAWLVVVVFFIDINLFIKKEYAIIKSILPEGFFTLYTYGLLPSMVWLLIHPARMLSILSTQQHEQDASRLFLESFFTDVFTVSIIPYLLILAIVGGMALLLYFEWKGRHPEPPENRPVSILRILEMNEDHAFASTRDPGMAGFFRFLRDPLVSITAIVLLQYVILEVTTGNKQLRHIYHLIPAFMVIAGLWAMRASFLLRISKRLSGTRQTVDFISQAGTVVFTLYLITLPDGILSASYTARRELCFTGRDYELYKPARIYASELDPSADTIVINRFHNPLVPSENRRLASEFDLLGRVELYPEGSYMNDNVYRRNSWTPFEKLIVLDRVCSLPETFKIVKERQNRYQVDLELVRTVEYANSGICIQEYEIIQKDPEPRREK